MIEYMFGPLINKLRAWFFGTLTVAEIRSYPWDGASDLYTRSDWADFYGDPYFVTFAVGETTQYSGWVDVRPLSSLLVTAECIGSAADALGEIQVIFEYGLSVLDPNMQFERDDLVISFYANGTNTVYGSSLFPLIGIGYLRVKRVVNMAGNSVSLRIYSNSTAKPVNV